MSEEEIKPCPFCGYAASVEEVEAATMKTGAVAFSVGCSNPDLDDCYGYQSLTTFSRRSDAIKAWNRRS